METNRRKESKKTTHMRRFKYGGKDGREFKLVEAEDLVVVRTTEDADLRSLNLTPASRSLAAGMVPILAFPEANVTVYRVVGQPDEESVLKTRNAIRRSLNEEGQVRFAGRTLIDAESGEIVVYTENIFLKFKDEVAPERCQEIIEKNGLEIKRQYRFAPNAFFLKTPEGTGMKVFDIAGMLLELPEVESCHPELITERQVKSIHPMQWHLRKTTIGQQVIDQHIHVEDAWKATKGAGVTIAVIDNGVEVQHEAFRKPGKIAGQRNTLTGINDARPSSPFSNQGNHGTACAGVACADAPNGTKGVAPDARLMPIVCGSLGSLSEALAFEWAADNGADIISCSWGPPDGPWWLPAHASHQNAYALPDSTRYAIEYAATQGRNGKGCVILWAAGNGNESADLDGYASFEKVIAVGACNDSGRRSIYSDFGKAVWCCFPSDDFGHAPLRHPKPLTPGIWTADISGAAGANRGGSMMGHSSEDEAGNYTASFGGTSSACHGAAGVAALVLAVNPDLTREQVKDILKNACDRIDPDFGNYNANGHSPFYGYGRLNAAKAVKLAQESLPARLSLSIEGAVRFRNASAELAPATWVAPSPGPDRFMGLQLRIRPLHPDLGVSYQVFSTGDTPVPPGADGQLVMQNDKRRKVAGLKIALTGPLAAAFDIRYAARLAGASEPASAANGELCGDAFGAGPAIEAVWIEMSKKNI